MRICLLILFIGASNFVTGQFFQPSDSLNKKRLIGLVSAESIGYAGSLIMLNELWYKYYDRTSFHFFNDNPEWLQMDKCGHVMTSYYVGKVGYNSLRWTGVEKNKALWYGATLGSAYLLSMEVLDGFADEWGFSWGDIAANSIGTAGFMVQEHFWNEQRILIKFSAHLSSFAEQRPALLGYNKTERLLKDYNGQTYWLSVNPKSFLKEDHWFPKWLNIAAGYSGEEMISGRISDNPQPLRYSRYRQYYLSLDVDFSKITVSKPWLKPILGLLNMVKMPFPALELSRNGLKGSLFYF